MAGPGPKWITPVVEENRLRAMRNVIDWYGEMPFSTIAGTGSAWQTEQNEHVIRCAGLACTWPELKARAQAVEKHLPNYIAKFDRLTQGCEGLRAWAYVHAPDLISPTAEQPPTWLWW